MVVFDGSSHASVTLAFPAAAVSPVGAAGAGGGGPMRTISLSPAFHGCVEMGQVRVPAALSAVAEATLRVSDTVPSSPMKSTTWPERAPSGVNPDLHLRRLPEPDDDGS